MKSSTSETSKRRPITLTINQDVIQDAKDLKINASRAAEAGIDQAVREAREAQWLEENKDIIRAHNKWVQDNGVLMMPLWERQ